MKARSRKRVQRPVEWQASHTPFDALITYCARGRTNPLLQSSAVDDHVAELCLLRLDDVEPDLWSKAEEAKAARKAREFLDDLSDRVRRQADLRAANLLYSIATEAACEVLNLYLRHRELFDRITPHRKLLPCLLSIHPRTAEITQQMRRDACLGARTDDARRVGSKAWFLSDAPANIYARAIHASVLFNRALKPIAKQQASWRAYDRKYHVRTVILPFPKYAAVLAALPAHLTPASALAYWQAGKQIILEEMPQFHERPEWEDYRTRRSYANGAKPGAIQHAIFKDILAALRTIAGANKHHAAKGSTNAAR